MALHSLAATPATVRRGVFDGVFAPVLTLASGDTLVVQCVSGDAGLLPPPGSAMEPPRALLDILDALPPGAGPHIVTGPVAIAGAEPGDMLEVRVDRVDFGANWGFCAVYPQRGCLPDEFPVRDVTHVPIDTVSGTCRLPWGPRLKLAPFFGIMAVAPPVEFGTRSTREPGVFGGNIDNRELTAGSTLYLPVHVPGANFMAGDGHGMQGDGEVCVTALETCLTGTFTFTLHKRERAGAPLLRFPRAETSTHYISMGLGPDLDAAMRQALREMIDFICARTGWRRIDAYKTCSLAADFRVTQAVNGEKGVHAMLPRNALDDGVERS